MPLRVTYFGATPTTPGMEIGRARFIAATNAVDATVTLAEDRPLVQPAQVSEAGPRRRPPRGSYPGMGT